MQYVNYVLVARIQVASDARRASALSEISFVRATSSAGSGSYLQETSTRVDGARFGSSSVADSSSSGFGTLSKRPSSSGTKQLEQV